MRAVLFYSEVESFNYFTDQIEKELKERGAETFILDLKNLESECGHSYKEFCTFSHKKIDLVVCYDGIGLRDKVLRELWDANAAVVVDIFMDHPLRFHVSLQEHPKNYRLFCCDWDHVAYVRRYFKTQVEHVEFLPHAGTIPDAGEERTPYEKRRYDVLFSGTYYRPRDQLMKITEDFQEGTDMYRFYISMAEYLLQNSHATIEQAVWETMACCKMEVAESLQKTILRCATPVDWMIRMYHRERAVASLAEAGIDIWLLGRGWENHPCAGYSNVHRIDDRIPFAETLRYMGEAKINLNVMPWFKAGTHDRIFNVLLRHSLPLTDSSAWIDKNFTDGEDIALFDLERIEKLPEIVRGLLQDTARAEQMIANGYQKVYLKFTWKNCVDQILAAMEKKHNGEGNGTENQYRYGV